MDITSSYLITLNPPAIRTLGRIPTYPTERLKSLARAHEESIVCLPIKDPLHAWHTWVKEARYRLEFVPKIDLVSFTSILPFIDN